MKMTSLRINGRAVSRLTINGREVSLKQEPVQCDALCFTAQEPGSKVGLIKLGSAPAVKLQTSTDGRSWTPYVVGNLITLENAEDKVYFKAVGQNYRISTSSKNYNRFAITGKIAASGNINSLLEEDEETARTISLVERYYCYYNIFINCTELTQAPELPSTTLARYCYNYMFSGCTSLTKAPELPAIVLARDSYNFMFNNCTALTQAPALPATTLASNCYERMFNNCTALTQAPALPATALVGWCYNRMFAGCSSLTQAPELQATELAENCYSGMFENCTALTQAPALQETILHTKCYAFMFNNCTALTQAPELPATTLADSCYLGMFSGCTALTQAPELPATTLGTSCYGNMFNGCTSLNSIKVGFTNWDPANATNAWLPENSGTFECPQALIDNTTTRDGNTVPESWTMVAV